MKPTRSLFVLFVASALLLPSQLLAGIAMETYRRTYYEQNGPGAPSGNSVNFEMFVQNIFGEDVLASGDGFITALPGGSTLTPPLAMDFFNFGSEDEDIVLYIYSEFPEFADGMAAYPLGDYTATVPIKAGGSVDITGSLSESNLAVPTISNSGWSGGKLLFDPTVDFTLAWNPMFTVDPAPLTNSSWIQFFAYEEGDDFRSFDFWLWDEETVATSFVIPAHTFQIGDLVFAELDFYRAVDFTPAITGASLDGSGSDGQGSYVSFEMFAVPEPSSALLLLAAALAAALRRRP